MGKEKGKDGSGRGRKIIDVLTRLYPDAETTYYKNRTSC